jgi:hypothetical protein
MVEAFLKVRLKNSSCTLQSAIKDSIFSGTFQSTTKNMIFSGT